MSLLPPDLERLIADHLGVAPTDLAPTFGGFSNLTLRAELVGRPCVIKAATTPAKRADVQREADLLPALHAAGLPVPEPLAFVADTTWTVSITAALPGQNGLQVLSEVPAQLPLVFKALGRTLAAVHAAPPPAAHPDLDFALRVASAQASLADSAISPDLAIALDAALAYPVWSTTSGLVHGDSGLHNLLWGAEGLWLLDWEWAGSGPTLLDLAWLRWTMAWRALPAELWSAFLNGYGRLPAALDDATQLALTLGQIGLILVRAADQPAAHAEWLHRAAWTRTLFAP